MALNIGVTNSRETCPASDFKHVVPHLFRQRLRSSFSPLAQVAPHPQGRVLLEVLADQEGPKEVRTWMGELRCLRC